MPRSELERVGDRVRRLAGLPDPVHEHPLPSARNRLGFVDRAWPEAMFITEFDPPNPRPEPRPPHQVESLG